MPDKQEKQNKENLDTEQDMESVETEVESQEAQEVMGQGDPVEETEEAVTDESAEVEQEAAEPDLVEELAKAIAEKNEAQDKMLRMAADLENYKKRMSRERDTTLKYAGESLIKDLLPTIDNLGRALDHGPDADVKVFIEGVDMTLKGLMATLEKAGLTPLDSVGQPFDPNIHEAMVMEASKDVPEQHIITEFERGYHYKDRLLRAAKVIVSKGDV